MNSLSDMPLVTRPVGVPAAGMKPTIASPGRNRLTRIRPSDSEMSDATINHPSAFAPMRPTSLASPIRAMPTMRVDSTSGAMIILIRRRNKVVNNDMYSANCFGSAIVKLRI